MAIVYVEVKNAHYVYKALIQGSGSNNSHEIYLRAVSIVVSFRHTSFYLSYV